VKGMIAIVPGDITRETCDASEAKLGFRSSRPQMMNVLAGDPVLGAKSAVSFITPENTAASPFPANVSRYCRFCTR